MENGEAFVFGRTDWQYVLNTFCFGYKVGYRFLQTRSGGCNGNFLGIGADDCYTALVVDGCARFGLLITNGEFVSFHGPDPTMVVVGKGNSGSVRFVNCAFWGPCNQIARISGKGTVGFSDCTFVQWDHRKEGRAAVQVESGTVLIRGCEFQEDKPQIALEEKVRAPSSATTCSPARAGFSTAARGPSKSESMLRITRKSDRFTPRAQVLPGHVQPG